MASKEAGPADVANGVDQLRSEIFSKVANYYRDAFAPRPFIPGVSQVPVSGKVFDQDEITLLVDASLDFWLTTGRYAELFEQQFASFLGTRHASLCNSGS